MKPVAMILLALLPAVPSLLTGTAPGGAPVEERVEVRRKAWLFGQSREYLLSFEGAPLGRQAILLAPRGIRTEEGEFRSFEFDGSLDLRATGSPGAVFWEGTLATSVASTRPGYFKVTDSYRPGARYTPDPEEAAKGARNRTLQIVFREARSEYQIDDATSGRQTKEGLQAEGTDGVVDMRLPVLWGPLLEELPLVEGTERRLRLVVVAGGFRLDYHLDGTAPPVLAPEVRATVVRVGPVEKLLLEGRTEEAHRVSAPELGATLWVRRDGVLVRADTGWGLIATLRETGRVTR